MPAEPKVKLIEAPTDLEDALCQTRVLRVVEGTVRVVDRVSEHALAAGDLLVVEHAMPGSLTGAGRVVEVRLPHAHCRVTARPAPEVTFLLRPKWGDLFATGAVSELPASISQQLYVGRLVAVGSITEHANEDAWEILATVEASGTLTRDGRAEPLGPGQVVVIPPGVRYGWKAEPTARLAAVQVFSPRGSR